MRGNIEGGGGDCNAWLSVRLIVTCECVCVCVCRPKPVLRCPVLHDSSCSHCLGTTPQLSCSPPPTTGVGGGGMWENSAARVEEREEGIRRIKGCEWLEVLQILLFRRNRERRRHLCWR